MSQYKKKYHGFYENVNRRLCMIAFTSFGCRISSVKRETPAWTNNILQVTLWNSDFWILAGSVPSGKVYFLFDFLNRIFPRNKRLKTFPFPSLPLYKIYIVSNKRKITTKIYNEVKLYLVIILFNPLTQYGPKYNLNSHLIVIIWLYYTI